MGELLYTPRAHRGRQGRATRGLLRQPDLHPPVTHDEVVIVGVKVAAAIEACAGEGGGVIWLMCKAVR